MTFRIFFEKKLVIFGLPSAIDICVERVELQCVGRSYNVHSGIRISKSPVFLNNSARPKWPKMIQNGHFSARLRCLAPDQNDEHMGH